MINDEKIRDERCNIIFIENMICIIIRYTRISILIQEVYIPISVNNLKVIEF